MAKKVRFPLEMKNGVKARTLHDLMEYFDLEKILEYVRDGKLETWLRDRMCGEMADEVGKLDLSDEKSLGKKVCGIIFSADSVAFEQDDLYDVLEEGKDKVYLFGSEFEIPLEQKGIDYIGLNNPIVIINSREPVDWEEKDIKIKGCTFDEAYQKVLEEEEENCSDSKQLYEMMKKQNPEEVTHTYEELAAAAEARLENHPK